MMRYRAYIIILLFLSNAVLNAQLISVASEFSSDSIELGEQISYTISIETQQGTSILFPLLEDTLSREVEILDILKNDTIFEDSKMTYTREYLVTSFAPGWNTVAPKPVLFSTDNITDTIYTSAMLLTVLAPAVDTTQAIMPIKPPETAPLSFGELWWIWLIFGAFLLATLIAALLWMYFDKRRNPEVWEQKPLEPAHIVASRELEILQDEKLPQNGKVKEYYSRLTEIIRVYMSRQFDIHAMESTSSEILDAFAARYKNENELNDVLQELLLLADLVKFAKEDPLMSENEIHLRNAQRFVKKTHELFFADLEDRSEDNTVIEDDITPSTEEKVENE